MGESKPPTSAGEESVHRASDHLAAIVRSSDDAILSKDRDAIITSWNPGAERLYGYRADEMVGQPVAKLIPPELAGEEQEIVRRIFAGGRVEHYETTRLRRDGRRLRVSLTASPIHDADGRIVGVATQAHDLSETRKALRGVEERFRRVFEDAPIGISIFSVEPESLGRVIECNGEISSILGYSADELRDITAGSITHPDDAEQERVLFAELAEGKRDSYALEKRNRHKDGHWVWVWITVSLLRDEDPSRSAIAHVIDISERKEGEVELAEARENLERSNAELDQFAYVASHDLKEPLILLSAYARMLEEKHGEQLDDEGREFLGHIRDESSRMKAMIDDLLDYSRLETRAGETAPVDLRETYESACRTLGARAEEEGATIELEGELPVVDGTPSQFERLFRNLLSNALKFRADERPHIVVSSRRQGDRWLISVRDNGIGIDPSKAARVFEVFQRLHGQERYPGTGMGLAICKRIVERHGGKIWVEPAEGGGSVFSFTLPG